MTVEVETNLKVATSPRQFEVSGEVFRGQVSTLHTVEAEVSAFYSGERFHWKGHITSFTTEPADEGKLGQLLHNILSAELSGNKSQVRVFDLLESGASGRQVQYLLERFQEFTSYVEDTQRR